MVVDEKRMESWREEYPGKERIGDYFYFTEDGKVLPAELWKKDGTYVLTVITHAPYVKKYMNLKQDAEIIGKVSEAREVADRLIVLLRRKGVIPSDVKVRKAVLLDNGTWYVPLEREGNGVKPLDLTTVALDDWTAAV